MKVRLGLIGAGRIGRAYLEAALRVPEVELVGVADLRRDVLAEVQRRGVKAYPSVRQMLREADLEAVIVATPPTSHVPISMGCIEGGVHVLCEKPLALGTAEVETAVEAAEKQGLLFTMSSKFRFVPTVNHGREILLGGGLGEIVSFHIAFCARADMSGRWNLERVSGGGVVADNAPHAADIVRYLLGPITHVFAAPGRTSPGIEVEDSASLLMRVDSNLLGVVDLSWTHDRPDADFFSAYGASGCLHIGWRGSRHRTTGRADWGRLEQSYHKDAALRAQIENFARAVRGVEPPAMTVEELLANTRVVVAARRSLASERWEKV